jgi:hypothetical protein
VLPCVVVDQHGTHENKEYILHPMQSSENSELEKKQSCSQCTYKWFVSSDTNSRHVVITGRQIHNNLTCMLEEKTQNGEAVRSSGQIFFVMGLLHLFHSLFEQLQKFSKLHLQYRKRQNAVSKRIS